MTRWTHDDLEAVIREVPGYDPYHHAEPGSYFDPAQAAKYVGFIESMCRHVKGARAGQLFRLERWQVAVVANLFGWRREDGTRRYRECLIYVAKKNGKTTLESAIAVAVMELDGEPGCEVYSAAGSRDQAGLVFQQMAGMVRKAPALSRRWRVYGASGGAQHKAIVRRDDDACFYRALAADANTADGLNPHCTLVDELHRHKRPELAQVLHKSGASRTQPLTIYTTTADYARESLCNDVLRRAKEVRDNPGDRDQPGFDPTMLPVIYEAQPDDPIDDPATWAKANPNLGVTVPPHFMETEARKALENPSELNNFKRLHLNIVTDADEAWLPMERWDACAGPLAFPDLAEAMRGKRCYAGLDLSKRVDLTALALYFPTDHTLLTWFWMPKDTAVKQERDDPKRLLYSRWASGGFLALTDGARVDYAVVEAFIKKAATDYQIIQCGYDPWGAEQTVQTLEASGLDVVEMRQGHRTLGGGTRELEGLVIDGKLRHGGHPVLRWNAGNVVVRTDENLNIVPAKKRSTGQIDGVSASVMAISLAIIGADTAVDLDSVYAAGDYLEA